MNSELSVDPQLIKVESNPHVSLIIANQEGRVLGVLGGENRVLAQLLRLHAMMTEDGYPVQREDSIFPVGQDCFQVTREYVLSVKGTFLFSAWADIHSLERILPLDAFYTFVITV